MGIVLSVVRWLLPWKSGGGDDPIDWGWMDCHKERRPTKKKQTKKKNGSKKKTGNQEAKPPRNDFMLRADAKRRELRERDQRHGWKEWKDRKAINIIGDFFPIGDANRFYPLLGFSDEEIYEDVEKLEEEENDEVDNGHSDQEEEEVDDDGEDAEDEDEEEDLTASGLEDDQDGTK